MTTISVTQNGLIKNSPSLRIENSQDLENLTEPLDSRIQKTTHPLFRILSFLAGLTLLAAGAALVTFFAIKAAPLLMLSLCISPFFFICGLECIGHAVEGDRFDISSPQ